MKKSTFALAMFLITAVLSGFCFAGAARADLYTPLTLPVLNDDIRGWSDGYNYNSLFSGPGSETSHVWNGVTFNLAENSSGKTVYFSTTALTIPVHVYGVTNVYSLMNSWSSWGSKAGDVVGTMQFIGSGGANYTVNLIQGSNLRDHYQGYFVNDIDGVTAINAFTQNKDRLDMQIYNLPSQFATQTLESIIFTTDPAYYKKGQAFLAAATVASTPTPLPSALILFAPGLIGLGFIRRYFKK